MPSNEWYYVQDKQKAGPVSKDEIRSLYEDGTISGEGLVWTQGMSEWKPASQVQARFAAPAAAPPGGPPPIVREEAAASATPGMEPAIDMAAPAQAAADYDVGEGLGIDRSYAPSTDHVYAHFGLRLGALLIDTAIVFALNMVVMLIGGGVIAFVVSMTQGSSAGNGIATLVVIVLYGFLVAVPWLYYARQESGMKMATIGKRAFGLQVIDMNGYPISFARATGRYFGKILSGMFCAFGYFMALFTEKKQTLHDMLAACVVVKVS